MPLALSIAFGEQLASANMAFSLCMILSSGAVEALAAYGSYLLANFPSLSLRPRGMKSSI